MSKYLLMEERLVVWCKKSNPLAEKETLSPFDLKSVTIVCSMEFGHPLQQSAAILCEARGFSSRCLRELIVPVDYFWFVAPSVLSSCDGSLPLFEPSRIQLDSSRFGLNGLDHDCMLLDSQPDWWQDPRRNWHQAYLPFGHHRVFVGVFLSSFTVEMGPAALYLTFGVVGGLGVGFAYNPVMGCIQKWFSDKINLVTGIVVTCFGLATLVFSPIATALATMTGVESALRIMGMAFLVLCLIGWTQIKNPETGRLPAGFEKRLFSAEEQHQYVLSEALKTPQMWIMFMSVLLITWTFLA